MKKLLWFIAIILLLGFAWIVVLQPIALSHTKDGIRTYVESIPITGNEEERKATYSLAWGFLPLRSEIQDLKIQGPRGEWDNKMFFEPMLSVKYIKFDPRKMMIGSRPEIMEIGHIDFQGKIHFRTLLTMLKELSPNFHASEIRWLKGNSVQLTGVLQEVQSEIVVIGELKVDADGELVIEIKRVADFLQQEIFDARKKEKVTSSFHPKWHFKVMDVDLKVDKAAVSELGVFIEAESQGKKYETPQPVVIIESEEKEKEKEKGK